MGSVGEKTPLGTCPGCIVEHASLAPTRRCGGPGEVTRFDPDKRPVVSREGGGYTVGLAKDFRANDANVCRNVGVVVSLLNNMHEQTAPGTTPGDEAADSVA